MFENVDNIHTYIQTTEAYLSYKLTFEPLAFFMKLKKKYVSRKIRSRDFSIARDVFYHCTVLQIEVFR